MNYPIPRGFVISMVVVIITLVLMSSIVLLFSVGALMGVPDLRWTNVLPWILGSGVVSTLLTLKIRALVREAHFAGWEIGVRDGRSDMLARVWELDDRSLPELGKLRRKYVVGAHLQTLEEKK